MGTYGDAIMVLLPIEKYDRIEHVDKIHGWDATSDEYINRTGILSVLKGAEGCLFFTMDEFCDACNNEEIFLDNYWTATFYITRKEQS